MNVSQLVLLHLASVTAAFLIGSYLMLVRKGTPVHRALGKTYMLLMLGTAIVALLMPAAHPYLFDHFGLLHLFVLPVAYYVPSAYAAVRRGDIRRHRNSMIGLYIGALVIAGLFAFTPGRLLHRWFFE